MTVDSLLPRLSALTVADLKPQKQDPDVIDTLVEQLTEGSLRQKTKRGPFTCRKTEFKHASVQDLASWKFREWEYNRTDLPTHARGLFTAKNREGHYEIVVRGYDKFFNIDEVPATKWDNIKANTRGPYELSQKENGCIIFISGLEDGKLLVCSKHSTGAKANTAEAQSDPSELSHAEVGEKWVKKHVESIGRTTTDLARELRELNLTAVGELCDDSFEEHILAYGPERAGIYLHGLNYNLPDFSTLSGKQVHSFADAWGFKKAKFIVKETVDEVKDFLDDCAKTGSWEGHETEGFVIRCQKRKEEGSPYHDWFFKYKFVQPYLLYRQWRECTQAVIAGREPKIKQGDDTTRKYIEYVKRRFDAEPELKKGYQHNHGIIGLRDDFLKDAGCDAHEVTHT